MFSVHKLDCNPEFKFAHHIYSLNKAVEGIVGLSSTIRRASRVLLIKNQRTESEFSARASWMSLCWRQWRCSVSALWRWRLEIPVREACCDAFSPLLSQLCKWSCYWRQILLTSTSITLCCQQHTLSVGNPSEDCSGKRSDAAAQSLAQHLEVSGADFDHGCTTVPLK